MSTLISLDTIDTTTPANIPELNETLNQSIANCKWDAPIKVAFRQFLYTNSDHRKKLNTWYDSPDSCLTCVPIIAYHEGKNGFIIMYADTVNVPPEPGESGSVLSYFRAYGYDENTLCSDCYGQLSCSSCAVDIHYGKAENPTPREEEYDMLDIDEKNPPTEDTRLSCQTRLGAQPLYLMIRNKH